jgi:hypothetical protein
MSTETNDQPADAGVGGQGQAPSDDIDTEAFDRAPAPEDDDEPEVLEDESGESETEDKPAADDDSEEIEHDGQKLRIPKAVKPLLMLQADYTRKTQEVAAERRSLAEQAQAWDAERTQQTESLAALRAEHTKVAVLEQAQEAARQRLDRQVDRTGLKLSEVNWPAFRAQANADPELAADYKALWAEYEAATQDLTHYERQLGQAKTDLQTKEDARLAEHRTKAEAELRQARQETGRALAAEVKGWNAEAAKQTIEFANDHLGITPEEMADATDPRVWKALHGLRTAQAEIETLRKALKQQQTAGKHEKDQAVTPAEKPKGSGGAPRDPATSRGDGLSTDEWKRRRLAQKGIKAS